MLNATLEISEFNTARELAVGRSPSALEDPINRDRFILAENPVALKSEGAEKVTLDRSMVKLEMGWFFERSKSEVNLRSEPVILISLMLPETIGGAFELAM